MPPPIDAAAAPAAPARVGSTRPTPTITPRGNTPGYNPDAHYEQITRSWPKPQPLQTHRVSPEVAARPSPFPHLEGDVASYRANAQAINQRAGDGQAMMRRASDMLRPPTTTPGEAGRGPDFTARRFSQPQAPPHVGPVPDAAAPLPTSREGLDAMLAAAGLGPQHEAGGLGRGVRNFFQDEAGTAYWPPQGRPMPPNASSSGDHLMEGYGLARPKPASQPKPATTGTRAGPVKMRPGPGPQTQAAPLQPGVHEFALQQAHEGRLGAMGPAPAERPGVVGAMQNRRPGIPVPSDGPDMAAMRALHAPEVGPTPQVAGPALPRSPMYNPEVHGTPENFAALRQQWLAKLGPGGVGPAAIPPEIPGAAPRPGMVRTGAANLAKGAGLGLLFDTVNNPQGMADMVRNPGAAAGQMGQSFQAGLGRIASGNVGPTDLVTAVGNSLGMNSAFGAGVKMGNTMWDAATDPRRFGTNFANGLGVIGKGMGF